MEIRMQLALPRDARYVGLLRSVARCVLDDFAVGEEDRSDVELAVTEACTNAIRHAADSEDYRVALIFAEDHCEVEVVDEGPGFTPPPVDAPGAGDDVESGRGLQLIRALVDDLRFEREGDETRVRLIKRWTATAAISDEVPAP